METFFLQINLKLAFIHDENDPKLKLHFMEHKYYLPGSCVWKLAPQPL